MPEQIPPRWLRTRPTADGASRAALPLALRLKVRRKGYVFVLALASIARPLEVVFRDGAGRELSRSVLEAPEAAAFVPKGAVDVTWMGAVKLGYFPRSKLGLKLHAFRNGAFEARSLPRRWKIAGAAARDLRGAHGALLQGSPAHKLEQAEDYRRYRARFVEDFADPTPPKGELTVSFITTGAADAAQWAACLAALRQQSDPDWEWLVALPAGAAGPDPAILAAEPRVRVLPAAPSDPAAAFNFALDAAGGALIAPLSPRGRLTRDAVAMVRAAFAAHADCQVLYTDEERLDAAGLPVEGIFKPAFNRHLLRSVDYMGDLFAVRTAHMKTLGGARPGFGAAWLYDLRLRAADPLPEGAVRHVPRVAYARTPEMGDGSFSPEAGAAAARAVTEATGVAQVEVIEGRLRPVYPLPDVPPLVSFVIPTRDRADLLGLALRSLIAETGYRRFEIVIVDNGSVEPETFALFDEVKELWPATRVVRDDGGFNYPRICNLGVDAATGSIICLLNNDIEVVEPGWLDEMVALACLPGTGVVGAKLLFPDRTIQHAGVIAGLFAYAGHWFAHAAQDTGGYESRLLSRQNLSAVTGACLMIRRDCWEAIGPLDAERFAEDCNDIDLCLRAVSAGFDLVWTPFATLIHHESASRGRRRAKAHRERLKAQRARFEGLWHASTLVDPHYNPNLRRKSLYATLAAAPEGDRGPRTAAIAPPESRNR